MPAGQIRQQRAAAFHHGGGHAQVVQVLHQALQVRRIGAGARGGQIQPQSPGHACQAAGQIAFAKTLQRQLQGLVERGLAHHHVGVGLLHAGHFGGRGAATGDGVDGVHIGPDARAVAHLQVVQRLAQALQHVGRRAFALTLAQCVLHGQVLRGGVAETLARQLGRVALA